MAEKQAFVAFRTVTVTPFGGALWIAGWVLAAVGFRRAPEAPAGT